MVSPFMILPERVAQALARSFRSVARALLNIFPFLRHDLKMLDVRADAEPYIIDAFFSALIIGALSAIILFVFIDKDILTRFLISAVVGFYMFGFIMGINILYPKLKIKQISKLMDRDLSFALRDLVVQVRSGVMLYDALVSIAEGDYGVVSEDFKRAVRLMNSGYSEAQALELLALESKSEFMKKIVWQIANALHSGANVAVTLSAIHETIQNYHEREIKGYISSMNMLTLMFFLLAVSMPTLGIVFAVVLSSVGGIRLDLPTVLTIIGFSVMIQIMMIWYMRSLRPAILR